MNEHMQTGMAEATRLVRAGQLAEATALIQRTLGSAPVSNVSVVEADPYRADVPHVSVLPAGDDSSATIEPSKEGINNSRTPGDTIASRLASALGTLTPDTTRRFPAKMPGTMMPQRPVTPEVIPSSPDAGGQFVNGTYSNAAGTRAYKLYIPSGYTGQAVPLVVMLHGCTQSTVDFAAGTRMNVVAEDRSFLVAYPEQATSGNSSKCWNWFQERDQHREVGEPSLIAGITRQIMSTYQVDSSRVYIAGLSAGGAMAVILAATYPDLYAAVGVHSGLAYGAAQDMPSAFAAMQQGNVSRARQLRESIPLITFHGDSDRTVAPVNSDYLLDQWLKSASTRTGSVPGVKMVQGRVPNGHTYSRSIYHEASGRTLIEQWMIHQEGHAWSGGSSSGSYTDPQGPDASREMVRFFLEHPRSK